jgi:hypothetical protein
VKPSVVGLGLLCALGLAAGCGSGKSGKPTGPRLEARWTGADTAAFGAPATAAWCDSLNLLEILAIAGDTGIEIALYPSDGVAPGAYPIRPPAAADSLPPSAAVGLRWFAQTSVQGFQGDSGQVSLTRAPDGALSGRFRATARAISGNGRLTITGSFDDLRQRPATSGCSTAPPPRRAAPADSDEDGVD